MEKIFLNKVWSNRYQWRIFISFKFRVDCFSLKSHDQFGAINFNKCKRDFRNWMTWMTTVIPSLLCKLDTAWLVPYIIYQTNGSPSDRELVASNRFIDSSLEALKIDWSKASGDNISRLALTQPGSSAMMEDIELSLKLAKIIFFSIMLQTFFFNKPIK